MYLLEKDTPTTPPPSRTHAEGQSPQGDGGAPGTGDDPATVRERDGARARGTPGTLADASHAAAAACVHFILYGERYHLRIFQGGTPYAKRGHTGGIS